MLEGLNAPEDWGVADKNIWVTDQGFSGEAVMPVLEGYDVVGFSESVDFAVKLAPGKPPGAKQWRDVSNRPVELDPGSNTWRLSKGTQQKPDKDLPASRMAKAYDRESAAGNIPSKTKSTALEKPTPKEPELKPPSSSSKPEEKKSPAPLSEEKRPIGKNFSLELTETNEQFLEKIKSEGKWNGTNFVDLRGIVGEQTFIPPRHLDALSRMLVTSGSDKIGWSYFGGDVPGGAGKIFAQGGELMTLAFTALPEEQSKKLQSVISETLKTQKENKTKGQIITPDWFQAAQDNRIAIINSIKSNKGEGASIVGGAWDTKNEVEELGMKDYDSEKGFSTDIYLRLSDGSLHQPSLKKDTRVNFLNSGAGQYGQFIITAHAENPESPYHEQAKSYLEAQKTRLSIMNELGVVAPRKKDGPEINEKWKKAVSIIENTEKESWAQPEESYNQKLYAENQGKRLRNVLSQNLDTIKQFDLSSIPTDKNAIFSSLLEREGIDPNDLKIKGADFRKLNASDKQRVAESREKAKQLESEALETAADNSELVKKAQKEMKNAGTDWAGLVDKIASSKTLNRSTRKLIHLAAINQKVDGYKEEVQQAQKDFISGAIEGINTNPYLRDGMLTELKNNFPVRDVAEGKEVMAIGDLSFDTQTCRDIFGTTDFEQIKTGFKVATDKNGLPYLGWVGKAGDGPLLPLAKINVREDGVGYGSIIKHEMVLHPDFANRLRQANAKEYGTGAGRTFSELEFDEPTMKKQPTYEEYLEILKAKRASAASGGAGGARGANYADSMVFYKGKALGRCPAGTTRSGKTCVPSAAPPSKGPGYKQTDLGGLSQAQVKALSKARSTKDIIEAHKKSNKK
jgi:hypothetical protein